MSHDLLEMPQSTLMPINENADLVAFAANGCADSFEKLVRQYHVPLRAFLIGKVGDAAIADDLAQDVFMVVLRRIGTVNDSRSFQSWLFTIARNKAVDYIRKQSRSKESLAGSLEQQLAEPQARLFEDNEQILGVMQSCIRKLKPHARDLVQAFYFDNKTSEEIAIAQETKSSAVRMSLLRIRKALAKCIQKNTEVAHE